MTFTSPESMHAADHNEPAAAYLATMGRGLVDGHGWDAERAAAYLQDRPGIGSWDAGKAPPAAGLPLIGLRDRARLRHS